MSVHEELKREVEIFTVFRVECPHCGDIEEEEIHDPRTESGNREEAEEYLQTELSDFVSGLAWVKAKSEEYAASGFICESCFENEEGDWEQI